MFFRCQGVIKCMQLLDRLDDGTNDRTDVVFMEESCPLVAEENMNWDISDILIWIARLKGE